MLAVVVSAGVLPAELQLVQLPVGCLVHWLLWMARSNHHLLLLLLLPLVLVLVLVLPLPQHPLAVEGCSAGIASALVVRCQHPSHQSQSPLLMNECLFAPQLQFHQQ
jgi:hypothetical protein